MSSINKMPADNWRFGVMAAVAPQKRQCKFAREYPAGSAVEAPPASSRHHVICKWRTAKCDLQANKKEKNE